MTACHFFFSCSSTLSHFSQGWRFLFTWLCSGSAGDTAPGGHAGRGAKSSPSMCWGDEGGGLGEAEMLILFQYHPSTKPQPAGQVQCQNPTSNRGSCSERKGRRAAVKWIKKKGQDPWRGGISNREAVIAKFSESLWDSLQLQDFRGDW